MASRAQSAEARAQAFEEHEQWSEAAAAYREALAASPTSLGALLGLERVYDQLGMRDSILPVIARAVEVSPRDPSLRGIQLREVRATQGRAAARDVYEQWRLAAPGDLAPFRAYARILLADNDPRAADSVLKDAERVSGGARELAYETAMLRASLGLWESAAQAWHDAVGDRPYFAQAAAFSLLPTPAAQRAAVIAALAGDAGDGGRAIGHRADAAGVGRAAARLGCAARSARRQRRGDRVARLCRSCGGRRRMAGRARCAHCSGAGAA